MKHMITRYTAWFTDPLFSHPPQQGIMEMPIEEIKDAAEATHLCKHSFYSKGGQAWKAMAELEREKLVARKTGASEFNKNVYSAKGLTDLRVLPSNLPCSWLPNALLSSHTFAQS